MQNLFTNVDHKIFLQEEVENPKAQRVINGDHPNLSTLSKYSKTREIQTSICVNSDLNETGNYSSDGIYVPTKCDPTVKAI